MRNVSIKIKISEDIDGVAIAPETLNQLSNGSWSFMQPFKITAGLLIWHGRMFEAGDGQIRGAYLLVGKSLASKLGLKDGQKVTIDLSRLEPINRIQLEASIKATNKDGSVLPFSTGIQPEVGKCIKFEGIKYDIKSIDPREGYIDVDTTVEVLGKDGKVEVQLSSPIKRKLSTSKGKGFSQIIGMEDVIDQINLKVIMPIQNPSLAAKYMRSPLKGAIFNGPFGVGKTALVKATAEELGIPFYHIPNSIATSSMGPSYIQSKYQAATKDKEGAIVFIDEIDAVAPYGQHGDATTTALQEAMDGLQRTPKVFTIAATNNLHNVAEGLLRPGRFDIIINIKLPNENARGKLFAHFLSHVQTKSGIDFVDLAVRTASFTGADIEAVCKNAGATVLSDHCKTGKNQYISQEGVISEIQSFNPTGARILGVNRPKFTFDDMFGADLMKKQLKRKLDLLSGKVDSPYAVSNSTLMLLHGPSGTGKTMVAQCIASYLNCNFKYKPATSFKNKYVGETESNIRELFNTGRTYQPIVIFLDEIDSIGKSRSSNDPHTASALNELLTELDGIANNKGVFVVAATNRVEDLDPALLSRVSCEFKMGLPDIHQRIEVLKGILKGLPTDQVSYKYLSKITPNWSQRSLAGLRSAVIDKLALEEVSTVTTGVLEDIILQRPSESSNQSSLIGRES